MKRIICILSILLLVALTGCNNKTSDKANQEKQIEQYYTYAQGFVEKGETDKAIELLEDGIKKTDSEKLKKYLAEIKENGEAPSEEVEQQNKVDWQTLYKDYMSKTFTPDISYCFYDMNNDKIPELLYVTGTCEADYKIKFISIINDDCEVVGEFGFGHSVIGGLSKENALVLQSAHMDWERICLIKMIDDKVYSTVLIDIDHEFLGYDENDNILYKDYAGYRNISDLKFYNVTQDGILTDWKQNPTDNNDAEIVDLLNKQVQQ